jgi:hypothetical protein
MTASHHRFRRVWRGFSHLVIILSGLAFVGLLVLNITNYIFYIDSILSIFYHYLIPVALALAFFCALRLSDATKLSMALCLVSVFFSLYAAELYLILAQERRFMNAAEAQGKAFDRRKKVEVINDLRRSGVDAFPIMRAKSMLEDRGDGTLMPVLTVDGEGLLPLASIAETTVVGCNENGQRMVYKSDEHGFHNPPGLWEAVPVEIAIVGDSYAHGSCVSSDRNSAAWLTKEFGNVLNLGIGGFGPLVQLASIREYLEPLEPKTVLWFYYEGNDLAGDLALERRAPLLMKYYEEDDFRQNLMGRRKEISDRLAAYLNEGLVEAMKELDDTYAHFRRFLELHKLRGFFGLGFTSLGIFSGDYERDTELFAGIMEKARQQIESWDGRIVFVYLPEWNRYTAAKRDNAIRDRLRGRVLEILAAQNIPLIDIHDFFVARPDPREFFQYPGFHFNEDGYKLTAEAIAQYLRAQVSGDQR